MPPASTDAAREPIFSSPPLNMTVRLCTADKESEDGKLPGGLSYGASSMQGWRKDQEDTHIASGDVGGNGMAIFGVFDGHGGKVSAPSS